MSEGIQGLPGLGKGSFMDEETGKSQAEEDPESRLSLDFNL